jgi:hypothetical protein
MASTTSKALAPLGKGLCAVGGPILAGFLIDADLFSLGWRSMFLINLVLGGAALAAAVKLLPKDTGTPETGVDGLGSGFLAVTMLGLLYGLIDGSGNGWTVVPILAIALGLVSFVLFCRRQRTASAPLIQPSLLKNKGFTSGLILGIVFFAAVAGLLYVLSLFMQRPGLHAVACGAGPGPRRGGHRPRVDRRLPPDRETRPDVDPRGSRGHPDRYRLAVRARPCHRKRRVRRPDSVEPRLAACPSAWKTTRPTS